MTDQETAAWLEDLAAVLERNPQADLSYAKDDSGLWLRARYRDEDIELGYDLPTAIERMRGRAKQLEGDRGMSNDEGIFDPLAKKAVEQMGDQLETALVEEIAKAIRRVDRPDGGGDMETYREAARAALAALRSKGIAV